MASWALEQFGSTLQTKTGKKSTSDVLGGKTRIGIYFSAHWCPPCRGFTPVLAEFYDQLKEGNPEYLEIIFVSSDSDDASFEEYYQTMPWTSIPYSESSVIQALGSKYGVRGIPTFIILDADDGSIKDKDGRSTVASAKGDNSKAVKKWL